MLAISYDICLSLYDLLHLVWSSLKNGTNELIYKTGTLTDLENELMVTRGKGWGCGRE